MKINNTLLALSLSSLLAACGGGGGGGGSAPSNQAATTIETKNVVARRDFSFQVERKVQLDIQQASPDEGVIHVYTSLGARLEDGRYIADPTSHLTSIYPQTAPSTNLIVNVNWQALYVQWTPLNGDQEMTWQLELLPDQNQYLIQF